MKIRSFKLLFSFMLCLMGQSFLSCIGTEKRVGKTYYDSLIRVDSNNIPLDSLQFYFPEIAEDDSIVRTPINKRSVVTIFTKHLAVDSFNNKWYSKHLYALKEPLLFNKPFEKEIVRFLYLRTFNNPISIRIEKDDQKVNLYWKVCDGAGGYDPGKLIVDKSKTVDIEQWNDVLRTLEKASFWSPRFVEKHIGFDGSKWIIEATGNEYYQTMNVWCGGRLNAVGLYLLELTDLDLGKDLY